MFHITGGQKVGCAAILLGGNAKIILVFVLPRKSLQKNHTADSKYLQKICHVIHLVWKSQSTGSKEAFLGTENVT